MVVHRDLSGAETERNCYICVNRNGTFCLVILINQPALLYPEPHAFSLMFIKRNLTEPNGIPRFEIPVQKVLSEWPIGF